MAVGGVGRGGGKGRAGGVKGASGAAGAAGASFGGKVDKTESLVGPSGLVGSSNVQGPQAADPIAAQALAIARRLKNGGFKSKEEATKALVSEVLQEKLHMKSDALTGRIAGALQDDPRLNQVLERLWSKAE
ncbi:MAG: hypothetical protein EOO71_23810 [Myxococcaceae bacterium]|uniref:hypothetical protein n=1 Tax=unclassified Corallococcus TaxID=2685029 RepID=UPI000EA16A2E|nr:MULTISPECIES: hypothetical protein [unclassified Corallococcus]MCY1045155.1 hypothetical protein [Corallococcus sp. bb12-1]RKG94488.1 hypothetical protein D7V97_38800 [Corallococcus sp. CA053C]RYZ38490.1 MAG: hypothetical protein EOO71_23810 [Myxococcaceae bacterium]